MILKAVFRLCELQAQPDSGNASNLYQFERLTWVTDYSETNPLL